MARFAIIGFGEVGGIFARDLHAAGASGIVAYDIDEAAQARAAACGFVQVKAAAA
jgi:prephenate dehydrogenase